LGRGNGKGKEAGPMMGGDRSDEKGGNQPGDDRRIAPCMYNLTSLVVVSPSQPLTE